MLSTSVRGQIAVGAFGARKDDELRAIPSSVVGDSYTGQAVIAQANSSMEVAIDTYEYLIDQLSCLQSAAGNGDIAGVQEALTACRYVEEDWQEALTDLLAALAAIKEALSRPIYLSVVDTEPVKGQGDE